MEYQIKVDYLRSLVKDIKGEDTLSQCQRMTKALSRYAITTFAAMRYLDVYYPPARVLELRKLGANILTAWQVVETEQGKKHRVGLYVLGVIGPEMTSLKKDKGEAPLGGA
jgi:hypothetical protein